MDAIISSDVSIDFPKFTIDLLEFLTDDLRIKNPPSDLVQLVSNQWDGTKAALARELSISASRLGHYLKRRRDIPLGVLKRLLEALNIDPSRIGAQSLCIRASASASKPVCIPNYINPRIAYILGAIHDGCLWHKGNQYMIIVWQEKMGGAEWLRIVAKMYQQEFLCNVRFHPRRIQINSKPLLQYLGYLRSNPSRVPKIIADNPLTLGRYYVAAFTDTDGHVGKDIRLFQQSREKLEDIKIILELLQISTREIREDRTIHVLPVEGKSKSRFLREIPILHPKSRRMANSYGRIKGT
jgi:transcriptional regulator with XRE-family HTH domain